MPQWGFNRDAQRLHEVLGCGARGGSKTRRLMSFRSGKYELKTSCDVDNKKTIVLIYYIYAVERICLCHKRLERQERAAAFFFNGKTNRERIDVFPISFAKKVSIQLYI